MTLVLCLVLCVWFGVFVFSFLLLLRNYGVLQATQHMTHDYEQGHLRTVMINKSVKTCFSFQRIKTMNLWNGSPIMVGLGIVIILLIIRTFMSTQTNLLINCLRASCRLQGNRDPSISIGTENAALMP